jgi:hypothetical protein
MNDSPFFKMKDIFFYNEDFCLLFTDVGSIINYFCILLFQDAHFYNGSNLKIGICDKFHILDNGHSTIAYLLIKWFYGTWHLCSKGEIRFIPSNLVQFVAA